MDGNLYNKTAGGDMKVFVVEDSPAVLERLMELVSEVKGATVVGDAANFEAAVAGITTTRPDVALLDIKLADDHGSGIDVLARVRAELPSLRAIMLSNYATPQHMKASAAAGAAYFLDKSADFERLPAILGTLQREIEGE